MKRKIAIITILIVAFIIVGTVFGYSQHRRVEQKEQEKQKKEEYLLSIKDDLYKKTEQLKECSKKSNSLMAVGAAWRENFYEGLDKLLTESEHNMYIDKSEYYRKAGIERRKF